MSGIVFLGGRVPSAWMTARALQELAPVTVIIEKPHSKVRMVRNRIRKLGLFPVAGQVLFHLYYLARYRSFASQEQKILDTHGLSAEPFADSDYTAVNSVNDDATVELIRNARPDVVVINGTRIISRKTLAAIDAPFINTHTGVTPAYRGVHGGYWALATGDADNFGVTVHLVDPGVDTGNILYQEKFRPGSQDNYFTYLALQSAKAVPLLKNAVQDALNGSLKPIDGSGPSHQWYHPTLWGYFWTGWTKGIW